MNFHDSTSHQQLTLKIVCLLKRRGLTVEEISPAILEKAFGPDWRATTTFRCPDRRDAEAF